MAIRRKIEEIIDLGGSVKQDVQNKKQYKILSQKVRMDLLKQIDDAVSERAGMNRSAWIQEAIQEKLRRVKDV